MEHIINGLVIGAEKKFNIMVEVTGYTLSYLDHPLNESSTFHYKDAESLLLGLISLYDTGYASISVQPNE